MSFYNADLATDLFNCLLLVSQLSVNDLPVCLSMNCQVMVCYCGGQNYYTPAENYWGIIFRAIQVIAGTNYLYHYLPNIFGELFFGPSR